MRSATFVRVAIGLLAMALLTGCGGGSGNGAAPSPTLTAVTPTQGSETGNTLLTLTGANFVAGATITVGGSGAGDVTAVDSTRCTCRTPPGTPGPAVAVSITTPSGTATLPAAFTYLASNLGIVRARVKDPTGARLAGVQLALGGKTGTTDAQGNVRLEDVVAAADVPAIFTATGYVSTARRVTVLVGEEVTFEVMMAPIGTTQTIDVTTPSLVEHVGGGISIPAGGVVDGAGAPVVSAVVHVTTLTPSTTGYGACFPGPFLGKSASDGSENTLLSYGFVDVLLEDDSGNPLHLAPGLPAEVKVPIDPTADPGSATIPLWYYDPAQGLWVEEGMATRDGGAGVYRGAVTHVTPWNIDKAAQLPVLAFKRVTVLDSAGKPVVGAWVTAATAAGGVLWSSDVTDENGQVILRVPANVAIRVWARKGNVRSLDILETAPGAGLTIDNWITLDPAQIVIGLTWNAVPEDLDLHVTAPTEPTRAHIYRTHRGSLTALPYLELEANDVDGFGPETISVMRVLPGTYRCCVHNYSGQTVPLGLCNSGAQIRLEIAGDPGSPRFFVPPPHDADHLDNDVWLAFDLTMTPSGSIWLVTHNVWATTGDYHP